MGLKSKLKATITGLTPLQQGLLVFAASILPPAILWLQQIGAGAPITVQSGALLGSAILGGVLAFIVKMLSETPQPAVVV
jgi:hypothetical protein